MLDNPNPNPTRNQLTFAQQGSETRRKRLSFWISLFDISTSIFQALRTVNIFIICRPCQRDEVASQVTVETESITLRFSAGPRYLPMKFTNRDW